MTRVIPTLALALSVAAAPAAWADATAGCGGLVMEVETGVAGAVPRIDGEPVDLAELPGLDGASWSSLACRSDADGTRFAVAGEAAGAEVILLVDGATGLARVPSPEEAAALRGEGSGLDLLGD